MKNLILALIVILAVHVSGLAQQATGTLQVGVVAGPNHTFFKQGTMQGFDFPIESGYRWATGFTGKYQLEKFFLKAELLYENKGYRSDFLISFDGNTMHKYVARANYHYLTVPVLIGVAIPNTKFYVNAGPYAGALLSMKNNYDGPEVENGIPSRIDNTSMWKRFDFGLTGGLGYVTAISSTLNASAEIRHNLGIHDISNGPVSYRSRSTSLLLGLHYTIAGK